MKARWLPLAGTLGAALLLVNLNVLGARWYARWDATSERLYTLSGPTRELLRELSAPVDVIVLLGQADPMTVSVRHMLDAYAAESDRLRARWVDPDRSPAEFLSLQQQYGLLAGKADDGRIVTDAAIIVARGGRHWFVTADELVALDDGSGRTRPALEQALSTALAGVERTERSKLCFSVGQREPTLDDAGPEGLSELAERLAKNNYETVSIDPSVKAAPLADCRAVIVAAPELEFGSGAAARLTDYVRGGGSALLLLPPALGEDQDVRPTGLDPLLELAGMRLGRDVVIELDQAARLPSGSGELFFARLHPHPVTRGVLHDDERLSSKVLVVQSRSLEPGEAGARLLATSERAISLERLDLLARTDAALASGDVGRRGAFALAAARELASGSKPSRVVVSGASNLAWNRNYQDPALYGNRRLIENAVSWVAARPPLISIPAKAERETSLALTDESLGEIMRYVLLYMPGTAALLGTLVLMRRRQTEKQSRKPP